MKMLKISYKDSFLGSWFIMFGSNVLEKEGAAKVYRRFTQLN